MGGGTNGQSAMEKMGYGQGMDGVFALAAKYGHTLTTRSLIALDDEDDEDNSSLSDVEEEVQEKTDEEAISNSSTPIQEEPEEDSSVVEIPKEKYCVDPEKIVQTFPADVEQLKFDLTCVICWEDSGPAPFHCSYAHVICDACMVKNPEMETCPADMNTREKCGGKVIGLSDGVVNSPYFQFFSKTMQFKCAMKPFGCNVVANGYDIIGHELKHCPFRFMRQCGFQSSTGCMDTFNNIEEHVAHLLEDHKVPFCTKGEGHFLMYYDRQNFFEEDGKMSYNVVPLVRAVIYEGRKKPKFICTLMGKDMIVDKKKFTRIWFCSCRKIEENFALQADICIIPPPGPDLSAKKECIHLPLKVLPNMQSSVLANPADGTALDLANDVLDKFGIIFDEKKYFSLLVVISMVDPVGGEKVILPEDRDVIEKLQDEMNEVEKKMKELRSKPYNLYCRPNADESEKENEPIAVQLTRLTDRKNYLAELIAHGGY